MNKHTLIEKTMMYWQKEELIKGLRDWKPIWKKPL